MPANKPIPQYLMLYACKACGQESGFTELEEPHCRYCDAKDSMELISKQALTPDVMAARLRAVADNMMKNLERAYKVMGESEKGVPGAGKDAEEEMLKLLARVKKFRDQIHSLGLGDEKAKGRSVD